MSDISKLNPSTEARKRLYEVGIALIGVAAVYGLIDGKEAAAWALVLAPLFGIARANVEAKRDPAPHQD